MVAAVTEKTNKIKVVVIGNRWAENEKRVYIKEAGGEGKRKYFSAEGWSVQWHLDITNLYISRSSV